MEQPRVKIITPTKQEFNGINYWKGKRERYYRNAHHKPHALHRAVWEYFNGSVPAGMVIDHIDRDSNNNQIENLRAVTQSENSKNVSEETTQKRREQMARASEMAREWHKSDKGRAWHSKHGKDSWQGKGLREKICAHCGSVYYTRDAGMQSRFCSANCKMRARTRRLKGLPESAEHPSPAKKCAICGKTFYSPKFKAMTCSEKCRNKRTYILRKSKQTA